MRVAANDVERVLQQAKNEAEHADAPAKNSISFDNLVIAFKRANELRDKPYRTVMLRGRKSRKAQMVILTNQEKGDAGNVYVMCLVPYTAQQAATAGTYVYETEVMAEDGKKIARRDRHDSGLKPSYHEQWIRFDRLKEDSFKSS